MELATLPDTHFWLVDDDKVQVENIATSAFFMEQIGQYKVSAMAELMYRKAKATCFTRKETFNGNLSPDFDLVIDTFDNPASRLLTVNEGLPTIHIGVGEGDAGSVMWDNVYTPPEITFERGHNPICTRDLSRQLIQFTASVAVGTILGYFETGHKDSYIVRKSMEVIRV